MQNNVPVHVRISRTKGQTPENMSLSLDKLRDKHSVSLSLCLSLTFPDLGTKGRTNPYGVCPCPLTFPDLRTKQRDKPYIYMECPCPSPRGTGTGGLQGCPPCNPVP